MSEANLPSYALAYTSARPAAIAGGNAQDLFTLPLREIPAALRPYLGIETEARWRRWCDR